MTDMTQHPDQLIEDDGFITVSPAFAADPLPVDTSLRAALARISRKAEVMVLDAARNSTDLQDAEEIRQLVQIALRDLDRRPRQ